MSPARDSGKKSLIRTWPEGVHLVGPVLDGPLLHGVGRDGHGRRAVHLIRHQGYTGSPLGDVEVGLVLVAGAGIFGERDDALAVGFASQQVLRTCWVTWCAVAPALAERRPRCRGALSGRQTPLGHRVASATCVHGVTDQVEFLVQGGAETRNSIRPAGGTSCGSEVMAESVGCPESSIIGEPSRASTWIGTGLPASSMSARSRKCVGGGVHETPELRGANAHGKGREVFVLRRAVDHGGCH
jgi:hypothetical protein